MANMKVCDVFPPKPATTYRLVLIPQDLFVALDPKVVEQIEQTAYTIWTADLSAKAVERLDHFVQRGLSKPGAEKKAQKETAA